MKPDKDSSVYKIIDKDGKMTLRVEIPILKINRQKNLPEDALREELNDESIELKLDGTKLRKRRKRKRRDS